LLVTPYELPVVNNPGKAVLIPDDSTRIHQSAPDEFRKIFHRHGTVIEHGFMEATEVELIAKFALDLLTQAVMSHAAYKVGAQLRRALFGSNDFQPCFTFGLTLHSLILSGAMHFILCTSFSIS